MQDDFKFYQLSGKVNPMGLLWGILFGTLTALPLSFVYAYAVRYIPFIYLNFIISFGYVFVVALAYQAGEKKGQNRSRVVSMLGATIMAIVCLYLAWTAFLFVLMNHKINYITLVLKPSAVWSFIQVVVERGWFSMGHSKETVRGTFYAICLIGEALGYLWIFLWVGTLDKASIYCENCFHWLESIAMPSLIHAKLEGPMLQTATTGHVHWIPQLELTHELPFITLSLAACDSCEQLTTLSAKKVDIVVNKNNESSNVETVLFQNLLINKKTKDDLIKKLEELIKAQAAADEEAAKKEKDEKIVLTENESPAT